MRTTLLSILMMALLGMTNCFPQSLNHGGWSTANPARYTRITGTSNLESKRYKIDCVPLVDAELLRFEVVVDSVAIPITFQEGSSVTVEGKSIAIRQTTPGRMISGSWLMLEQQAYPALDISWSCTPSANADMLIASLKTEEEFVLHINASSLNCSNTSFVVMIDGQAVLDKTKKPLVFWHGSSVYGKGKLVAIRASGTCEPGHTVNGIFTLKAARN